MSNAMNGIDILKKMGLEEMITNPDFAEFVSWFKESVNEDNYLTEEEVVKMEEMKAAGTFDYDNDSVNRKIEQIVGKSVDDEVINELQAEYDDLKCSEEVLDEMLFKANAIETKMDEDINRLNSEIHTFNLEVESLTEKCREDAEMLEELRVKNIENRNGLFTSFSAEHSSPLRWCRLDLDNYCMDSDNDTLSLKLRFEEKLKLMSFADIGDESHKRLYHLQNIETSYIRNATAHFNAECDLKKVDILIDVLSKPFQPMSFALMREQIERLTWQNEEIEENIENVESTIKDKIAHLAYQEAKIVELENNKEKLQVAEKRLEILKKAAKPISDKLLLADLLWLSLHAEMETMKNVLENISTAHYEDENKQCARNLQILTRLSSYSTKDHVTQEFTKRLTDLMADDGAMRSDELANPIAKYTEWTNQQQMQLKHSITDSYQLNVVNLVKDFDVISAQMNAFIGNGPTNKQNIWNLTVLAELEIFKRKFELIFDASRTMRHDFMEKYHHPFVNDELWKNRQLLWIWFLTDQKTFLEVYQKIVSDSKAISRRGRMSIVGGIKRQQ